MKIRSPPFGIDKQKPIISKIIMANSSEIRNGDFVMDFELEIIFLVMTLLYAFWHKIFPRIFSKLLTG